MKIIAHRGLWENESEKNTSAAFRRALEGGFGIETDIRDCAGAIVISHNPPLGGEMECEAFFELCGWYGTNAPLALNIKSCGLAGEIKKLIQKYAPKNYFVFDMAVCDTIDYIKEGVTVFSRKSEFEKQIVFMKESAGVWYDMFDSGYFRASDIPDYISAGKRVCIVSPELHGRDYKKMWQEYKKLDTANLMLCTDKAREAEEYFNGNDSAR